MKTITGTYVWSGNVEVEVSDDATPEQMREALDNEALKVEIDFKHPILVECSIDELID